MCAPASHDQANKPRTAESPQLENIIIKIQLKYQQQVYNNSQITIVKEDTTPSALAVISNSASGAAPHEAL